MACSSCGKQRSKLANAVRSGNAKETVTVAVEGIKMMVGLEAGQIKLLPSKKDEKNG